MNTSLVEFDNVVREEEVAEDISDYLLAHLLSWASFGMNFDYHDFKIQELLFSFINVKIILIFLQIIFRPHVLEYC